MKYWLARNFIQIMAYEIIPINGSREGSIIHYITPAQLIKETNNLRNQIAHLLGCLASILQIILDHKSYTLW